MLLNTGLKFLMLFLEIINSVLIVCLHLGLKKYFSLFLLLFFLMMIIQLNLSLMWSIFWHKFIFLNIALFLLLWFILIINLALFFLISILLFRFSWNLRKRIIFSVVLFLTVVIPQILLILQLWCFFWYYVIKNVFYG